MEREDWGTSEQGLHPPRYGAGTGHGLFDPQEYTKGAADVKKRTGILENKAAFDRNPRIPRIPFEGIGSPNREGGEKRQTTEALHSEQRETVSMAVGAPVGWLSTEVRRRMGRRGGGRRGGLTGVGALRPLSPIQCPLTGRTAVPPPKTTDGPRTWTSALWTLEPKLALPRPALNTDTLYLGTSDIFRALSSHLCWFYSASFIFSAILRK